MSAETTKDRRLEEAAETAKLHGGDTPKDLNALTEVSQLDMNLLEQQERTSPTTVEEMLAEFERSGLTQDSAIAKAVAAVDVARVAEVSSMSVAIEILVRARLSFNQALVLAHELDAIVQGQSPRRQLHNAGVTDMGLYAEGGFGEVHLAREGGKTIARKVTHAEIREGGRNDPSAVETINRARFEAQLLKDLKGTPGIFQYVDDSDVVSDGRTRAQLRTQFVSGRDLDHDYENAGPDGLNKAYVLRVILHAAMIHRSLHSPHLNKTNDIVVSRDTNARNIRVGNDGTVSMGDFGLARRIKTHLSQPGAEEANSGDDSRATKAQQALGSPYYAAPEQYENPLKVGPEADVFALGVTLYKGLTGKYPFPKQPADFIEAVKSGNFDEAAVPAPLRATVRKCFAYQATDRLSAEDLARDVLPHIPDWNKRFGSIEEFNDAPIDQKRVHEPITVDMAQHSEAEAPGQRHHASGIVVETRARLHELGVEYEDGPAIIPILPDGQLQKSVSQMVGPEPEWTVTAAELKGKPWSIQRYVTIAGVAVVIVAVFALGAWKLAKMSPSEAEKLPKPVAKKPNDPTGSETQVADANVLTTEGQPQDPVQDAEGDGPDEPVTPEVPPTTSFAVNLEGGSASTMPTGVSGIQIVTGDETTDIPESDIYKLMWNGQLWGFVFDADGDNGAGNGLHTAFMGDGGYMMIALPGGGYVIFDENRQVAWEPDTGSHKDFVDLGKKYFGRSPAARDDIDKPEVPDALKEHFSDAAATQQHFVSQRDALVGKDGIITAKKKSPVTRTSYEAPEKSQ